MDAETRPENAPLRKDPLAWFAMALAVLLAAGFFTLTWRTGDDARYIGLARSLLEGKGFAKSYLPHDPPETITPPAQPALIAGAMLVFGRGVVPGQLASVAMFLLGTLAIYAWARRRLGDPILAFCATVMGQFSMAVLTMSCWYMVEMHYIASSFAAVWLAERGPRARGALALVFGIGLLSGYVYLVRATGLALAAAGGIYFLSRRQWKPLVLFGLGFLALAGPWMLRTYLLTGATEAYLPVQSSMAGEAGGGYPWGRIPNDIATAFPVYFVQALPDALFYRLFGEFGLTGKLGLSSIDPLLRFGLLGLILLGFASRLRRPAFGDWYWIFYWLIITAPPFPPQGHWYVYPVLPMAAVYVATAIRVLTAGAARISARVPPRRVVRVAFAGLAAYTLATAVTGAWVHWGKERQRAGLAPWAPERYTTYRNEYMDAWGRMVEAALWVQSNCPPDTLVASRQPNHVYLITGREGWRYDLGEVPGTNLFDRMRRQADTRPVVLIEDSFSSYSGASFSYGVAHWALRDLFASHAEAMEKIYETGVPVTRVWRYAGPRGGAKELE